MKDWRTELDSIPPSEAVIRLRALVNKTMTDIKQAQSTIEAKHKLIESLTKMLHDMEQYSTEVAAKAAQAMLIPKPQCLPKPSANRCSPPCGKVRYKSKHKAVMANTTNDKALRVYFSINCNCYHITRAE